MKQNRKRNNQRNKNKKSNKNGESTLVQLQGLSNLKRLGDVKVAELREGKGLKTEFTIDPVNMEVKRPKKEQRERSIMSRMKLYGKMLFFVSSDGTPAIRQFHIRRPQNIVNIGRRDRPDERSAGTSDDVEPYVKLITSVAARKLASAATDVLKTATKH